MAAECVIFRRQGSDGSPRFRPLPAVARTDHRACSPVRCDLAALRNCRPGGWHRVSCLDGICGVSLVRNASDGTCAQHRRGGVFDMGLQPQSGRRLGKAQAAVARITAHGLHWRLYRTGRATLQKHHGCRSASRRRDHAFAARTPYQAGSSSPALGCDLARSGGRPGVWSHWCRWRRVSGPDAHCTSLGLAEADCGTFSAVHLVELDGRARWRSLRRAVTVSTLCVVRGSRPWRRHDRNGGWSEMAVPISHPICAGRHLAGGRHPASLLWVSSLPNPSRLRRSLLRRNDRITSGCPWLHASDHDHGHHAARSASSRHVRGARRARR